jgi:hypothetical protein
VNQSIATVAITVATVALIVVVSSMATAAVVYSQNTTIVNLTNVTGPNSTTSI